MWKLKSDKIKFNYLLVVVLSIIFVSPLLQAVEPSATELKSTKLFARIDDLTITQAEFMDIFRAAVRQKYYQDRKSVV